MGKEDQCINEKKGLLQECLPGVTLQKSHGYHRRNPSYSSSVCSQEIEQLQQNILVSTSMNKRRFEDTLGRYSAPITAVEMVMGNTYKTIGDDKDHRMQDDSDDDMEDMSSFSFSIRRAAAISEAKRRTEEQFLNYLKMAVAACFVIFFFSSDRPLGSNTNDTTIMHQTVPPQTIHPRAFRFHRKHQNIMEGFDSQYGDDSLNEKREILVLLKDLDEAIQGNVILRSNKTKFRLAARVWQEQNYCLENTTSSLSSSPLAVVEAATLHDVQLSVPILAGLAHEYGLDFRVRSGGFAYMGGYSTVSDGVVLSLAKLNSITMSDTNYLQHNNASAEDIRKVLSTTNDIVESHGMTGSTGTKTVVVGPGVRMEDFMKTVLGDNGYSSIVASTAGVGMGGFVLGGGYGLQSRMYGLAIDNIVGLQVVLASGEIRNVTEGDDLFWAIRGSGGGNIGVVTSIEYRVYPSHDIKLAATVKVPLEEMTQFLVRLGQKESELAPEFTLNVHGYELPNDRSVPEFVPEVRLSNIDKIRDESGSNNGLVKISMFWMGLSNPDDPVGMQYIKKEIIPLFSNTITADNVDFYYFSWSGTSREREQRPESKSVWSAQTWNGFLMAGNNTQEIWTDIESSLSALFLYCKFVTPRVELWGGAISKIPSNATAFPHREAVYNIAVDLQVPTEGDADAASDEIQLVNAIWPSIARHLGGVYVNYPMASLSNESYPLAYWGSNLDRLEKLKNKFDSSHGFNISQSIPALTNASFSRMIRQGEIFQNDSSR